MRTHSNKYTHRNIKTGKLGKKLLGAVMALTMAVSVGAPAAAPVSAGPITRNSVAAVATPVHVASHLYQVHALNRYFQPYNWVAGPVVAPLALIPNPLQPMAMADRLFWCGPFYVDAFVGIPTRAVTGAQVAHAAAWDAVDLAALGFVTAGNTAAIALSVWTAAAQTAVIALGAMVATPVALGTAALAVPAVGAAAAAAPVALGTGALGTAGLGAAALGTTAVVGTGLALGAGALATTAVVGTGAALAGVGGLVALNALSNRSDDSETQEATDTVTAEDESVAPAETTPVEV